jgi:hypothetical protein
VAYPLPEFPEFTELQGDALEMSMDDMEAKNIMLKERVKELESTLMPPPIFSTLVSTVQPWKSSDKTP